MRVDRRMLLCVLICTPTWAQSGGPPADADVLRTLRSGHPRLLVLDEDFARVRELIETNADARRLHEGLVKYATRVLDDEPVVHRLIGPRLLDQSRTCLHRVSTLAALYRLDGDPLHATGREASKSDEVASRVKGDRRFADRAIKEMLTAAAFPDWNPRHFLDTAEMANALGIGYDWLYDVLSAEQRRAIRTAIVEKGLTPGLAVYRKGGWWADAVHNWNQVCNGGMTVGALAIADEERAIAAEVIGFARRSIPRAMATFAPDGGWPEGPGYWNYATRYTAYYWAALNTALDNDFDLKSMPGFADTGLFRIHCEGPTGLAFNYADGGSTVGGSGQMMYFARLFDRPVYAAYAREHRSDTGVFDLLWYDARGTAADIDKLPAAAWFRGIDVAFLRSKWHDPAATFVGFKGGDNRANHSHLDLGTFVLDGQGERWAVELGADDYNMPGYFGSQRWTYYRLRTEGQNTLVINGENQDPKAKAPIVAFDSSSDRSFAVADLSAAYAKHARRVQRGVALLDSQAVLIQDEIDAASPVEVAWSMHTTAAAEPDGRDVIMTLNGKTMRARVLEPASAAWTVEEVKLDPPLKPLRDTRKLMLGLRTEGAASRIVVLMSPGAASAAADAPVVRPLAQWLQPVGG
ncbi:MAG: heparinase II/III family protein [Planctomycetes bacterium]|nr:heparinase II/III family protein [Planctomycetota bacterium]